MTDGEAVVRALAQVWMHSSCLATLRVVVRNTAVVSCVVAWVVQNIRDQIILYDFVRTCNTYVQSGIRVILSFVDIDNTSARLHDVTSLGTFILRLFQNHLAFLSPCLTLTTTATCTSEDCDSNWTLF